MLFYSDFPIIKYFTLDNLHSFFSVSDVVVGTCNLGAVIAQIKIYMYISLRSIEISNSLRLLIFLSFF